ncbi:MAG TPA: type 1 glutamine amidotransferase domain-containing protein [Ignavibacteriaceae bacterium]|nr:type 1 glutamine amidotransferase domain-containing protein [Ignavibacteriaceae bacterium]
MKPKLTGKKILMFVDDIYEDLELWYPKIRMIEEGAQVIVAGSYKMKVYSGKHGYPCKSDASFDEISAKDFDALVIPGGFAPDKLRREKKVLDITRDIFNNGKLIAHICHAGWIPISAGIMKGFKCTSTPGIKDDLINAGADWVNEPVVVDRNMISSRNPGDLPEFCRAIIKTLSQK